MTQERMKTLGGRTLTSVMSAMVLVSQLSAIAPAVYAAGEDVAVIASATKTSVAPGESVSVSLHVTGDILEGTNYGLAGEWYLSYDPTEFSVTSIDAPLAWMTNNYNGKVYCAIDEAVYNKDVELCTVVFTAAADATNKECTFAWVSSESELYSGDGSYDYTRDESQSSVTVKVNASSPCTITTPPTGKKLTFTGEDQVLVEQGAVSGGTMQYSLDGTNFSEELPKGNAVGTYTVYYKGVGDSSHSDTEAQTVEATIGFENGIGARLAGHSLALDTGEIGVLFHMELDPEIISNSETYMEFTFDNGKPMQSAQIDPANTYYNPKDGKTYYWFKCTVAAKEMTDTIHATLHSGSKSSETYEYTVKDYARDLIKISTDTDEVALAKAMLNYGAYSQLYFGYMTGNLANEFTAEDGITVEDDVQNTAVTYERYCYDDEVGENSQVVFGDVNLELQTRVSLNMYFTNKTDAPVTAGFKNPYPCSIRVYQDAADDYENVKVVVEDIPPEMIDYEFKMYITADGTQYDFAYSPRSYIKKIVENSNNPKMVNLARALYLYNQAAKAYATD